MIELRLRSATPGDAEAVARLHAGSWRRHYRGAYSDAFLDGDVAEDRLAVWSERLADRDRPRGTVLAEDGGGLVGFANAYFDDDPAFGALLDNLHVLAGHKRQGIGTRLLTETARAVAARPQVTGLYLWVLEQNTDGQAFYTARGGEIAGAKPVSAPGGVASRLHGTPVALRIVWPDVTTLG